MDNLALSRLAFGGRSAARNLPAVVLVKDSRIARVGGRVMLTLGTKKGGCDD